MNIPKVMMNNGLEIPIVGLGTWQSQPGDVKKAVIDAIEAGYTHFDCAHVYENEEEVGAAIKEKIADGTIARKDIFITSKLWNTYHSFAKVEEALRKSLDRLGVEYLDLYLIHWPMGYDESTDVFYPKDTGGNTLWSDVDYLETWKGMEHVASLGLTKSIGISNFNSQQIKRILDHCTIKPAVNEIESHPYLNNKKLIDFCGEHGIVTVAYSPLGSPQRSWAKPDDPVLLEQPKLKEIAAKYSRSVSQVVLRFQTQRGIVVIPKSANRDRIIENLRCTDFDLSAEDIAFIESLDCNFRMFPISAAKGHPYYPFHVEF